MGGLGVRAGLGGRALAQVSVLHFLSLWFTPYGTRNVSSEMNIGPVVRQIKLLNLKSEGTRACEILKINRFSTELQAKKKIYILWLK